MPSVLMNHVWVRGVCVCVCEYYVSGVKKKENALLFTYFNKNALQGGVCWRISFYTGRI